MHRFLPFLLLAACADTAIFEDSGTVCIDEATDQVLVQVNTCLSSSCDTLVEASCEAILDGDTLTVTSYAEVRSEGSTCTDDCGLVRPTCALPDGDLTGVTVVHGGTSAPYADVVGDCDTFGF